MASIKIILRTSKKNKEGKHPIAIQIIKDRRPSLIHLGHYVTTAEWDAGKSEIKKCHPSHVRLNNLLKKKVAEASNTALDLENQKDQVSAKAIKQKIKPTIWETFFPQALLYLSILEKSGKFNQLSADSPRVERFREFVGGDIPFSEITVTLLNRFKAWLKGTRNISERTAVNHLIVIRTVFNQAIKSELVDAKYYPFGRNKVKIKFPDTSKIGLLAEEITALETVSLPSKQHDARNLFLFSLYLAGMRVSDVLRLSWNDIDNGRLHYVMGKNNKGGSLKIPKKARDILNQYSEDNPKHGLVFHQLKSLESLNNTTDVQRRIKVSVRALNEQLGLATKEAKIKKHVTMHIARHSFGQLAGDKIDIRALQMLYRHTSLQTTIGYQSNFIHKKADEALDSVLDF